MSVDSAEPLANALAPAANLPRERIPAARSGLALACWPAHQVDEPLAGLRKCCRLALS